MRTINIKVKSYDVFENGRLKLSSLLKYMQQLAREDSDAYGATYAAMRGDNMVFVITKLALEFDGDIYDGDEIEIQTSSHAIEGVTFVRRFIGIKNGERVFSASTDWVLMDFVNRRVLRPAALNYAIPTEHFMDVAVQTKRRIALPDCAVPVNHTVRYTELDENRHLNNTVYADMLFDNLPTAVPDKRVDKCFINFMGEAYLGDELGIYADCNDGVYRFAAVNIANGKQCYTAELTFYGE